MRNNKDIKDIVIENIARIICEKDELECSCPDPSHVACTVYNKARDIWKFVTVKEDE